MKPLEKKIAVVAGATRGAGRGIACMLGEAGATVYCTGRSIRKKPKTRRRSKSSPFELKSRPETIEETAEMVTARGGVGIHAQVDHTVEEQVEALFKRVKKEQGRLDILVNDIWGGDELTEWGKPFWKLDPQHGRLMLERAVYAHILTSRYGVPLMIEQNHGLIVEITDGDDVLNRNYRGHLFYDLVKVSAIRLAYAMSQELRDYNITAVALTPGFLRSEAMLDHFGVTEENWRDAIKKEPSFAESETPFFVGRAVAALAADPNVKEKSGKALSSWNLAKEYGFTDIDGRQPNMGERIAKDWDDRWNKIVAAVQDEFRKHEQNPDREFECDQLRLELRARLNPGSDSPKWYVWPVMGYELWMSDTKTLAAGFYKRYRKELDKQQSTGD
jgi:NAD(P)-dependent dehydrogenase (short-subunit alcohol dehydrogenase family)